jgi:hypothetical protein
MPRLIPAAQQMMSEIADTGREFKTVPGDPDGYGFIRRVTFDAKTSKWLVPLLEAVEDPRIRQVLYNGKGRAEIWFVGDTRADFKDPFGLAAVDKVLND